MKLDSETLKKRLRYQGAQYSNGNMARGGSGEVHMLTQAADRIAELENALGDLLNDCINFNGGELTTRILEQATDVLQARRI